MKTEQVMKAVHELSGCKKDLEYCEGCEIEDVRMYPNPCPMFRDRYLSKVWGELFDWRKNDRK